MKRVGFFSSNVRRRMAANHLGIILGDFAGDLQSAGYLRTIQEYLRVAEHFGFWLGRRHLTPRQITPEVVDTFVRLHSAGCRSPSQRLTLREAAVRPYIGFGSCSRGAAWLPRGVRPQLRSPGCSIVLIITYRIYADGQTISRLPTSQAEANDFGIDLNLMSCAPGRSVAGDSKGDSHR